MQRGNAVREKTRGFIIIYDYSLENVNRRMILEINVFQLNWLLSLHVSRTVKIRDGGSI